ncbi:hypothetical protein DH2020_015459 [Rehmannia glutinosa]|uniref:Shikimate kinase n=1 Tax=Rehmannia glutinosa TaxID=99300 RepID=A0ABR0WSP4_REHGL
METRISMGLQLGTWINPEKIARKPNNSFQFFQNYGEQRLYRIPATCHLLAKKIRFHGPKILKVSCSSEKSPASVLEAGSFPALLDESKIIKIKSEEIEPYLNGRCIYLVGMMGSGKTTVGKVLSEALGYSFYDCDTLIEEAVGGSTVAEIFKSYGEGFFRDNEENGIARKKRCFLGTSYQNLAKIFAPFLLVLHALLHFNGCSHFSLFRLLFLKTEVLKKLSAMHRLIVSTGGGAVVRPVNWRHMRKGISVWLDVPLEALARRITAVGTDSRPLLHHESGDPYSKTMKRLSTLFEQRGDAYANADVRVSLENIAAKLGSKDVCNLTPTIIAIESSENIEDKKEKELGLVGGNMVSTEGFGERIGPEYQHVGLGN